uniref:Cytochrome b561 domain-containing protein n=1 Tax=Caenorhabditis tropicalis TaxID=1561998 RepID=A0A1I7USZ3_9PELO
MMFFAFYMNKCMRRPRHQLAYFEPFHILMYFSIFSILAITIGSSSKPSYFLYPFQAYITSQIFIFLSIILFQLVSLILREDNVLGKKWFCSVVLVITRMSVMLTW